MQVFSSPLHFIGSACAGSEPSRLAAAAITAAVMRLVLRKCFNLRLDSRAAIVWRPITSGNRDGKARNHRPIGRVVRQG